MNKYIELLSPAKNLDYGIAAIDCGADAVYIGAPKFGARNTAGNSIEDIGSLVNYAHKFGVKVYVTVNTLLYDNELVEVQDLIRKLYDLRIDAVIFQDMALLELDLPPIQLFASTQTHNYNPDKIKFLDSLGINRIILARELSLKQISEISKNVKCELEFFVHGALCVCFSGQCYLSYEMMERSANRGECGQPCRLKYDLVDKNRKILIKNKNLLSIHDLNLSAYLNDLINAGITSFKIEGRLKDISYVKNITAHYRRLLDDIIANNTILHRASAGHSYIPFKTDPDKTFNRGYTDYFINGKAEKVGSINTPKSMGKYLGKVTKIEKDGFFIQTDEKLQNGDGICFFDSMHELKGFSINKTEANKIFCVFSKDINLGMQIFRNYDSGFEDKLKQNCTRKIEAEIFIKEVNEGLEVTAVDEQGISVTLTEFIDKEISSKPDKIKDTLSKQFSKSGDTIFAITKVQTELFPTPLFLTVSTMNNLRRNVLIKLENERIRSHHILSGTVKNSDIKLNEKIADYRFNIVNGLSGKFYNKHGVELVEDGFELQKARQGMVLMQCKYCIKEELGICPKYSDQVFDEPLFIKTQNKIYRLEFNCRECIMSVLKE